MESKMKLSFLLMLFTINIVIFGQGVLPEIIGTTVLYDDWKEYKIGDTIPIITVDHFDGEGNRIYDSLYFSCKINNVNQIHKPIVIINNEHCILDSLVLCNIKLVPFDTVKIVFLSIPISQDYPYILKTNISSPTKQDTIYTHDFIFSSGQLNVIEKNNIKIIKSIQPHSVNYNLLGQRTLPSIKSSKIIIQNKTKINTL